jgi:hypothetical protein
MDKTYNFSIQQKKEIKKILNRTPGFSKQGQLGEFFDKYLLCEALARKIIEYKRNYSKKQGKSDKFETLNYTSIESALKFYKYNSYINIIVKIFKSGDGIRDEKTPRQLRNGYFHNLSEEDRKEIETRSNDLISLMNDFINQFK